MTRIDEIQARWKGERLADVASVDCWGCELVPFVKTDIPFLLDQLTDRDIRIVQLEHEHEILAQDVRKGCSTCANRDTARCGMSRCKLQGYGYWRWRGAADKTTVT